MPKQTKVCRVCGAEYEACGAIRNGDSTFRWREVACSPKCGQKYLEMVMAARNPKPVKTEAPKNITKKEEPKKEEVKEVTLPEPDEDGLIFVEVDGADDFDVENIE